jgi:hypothetical protein
VSVLKNDVNKMPQTFLLDIINLHLLKQNWRMNVGRKDVIDAIPRHKAPYMTAVK